MVTKLRIKGYRHKENCKCNLCLGKAGFQKGHTVYEGCEKSWFKKGNNNSPKTEFKKGETPWNKGNIKVNNSCLI